MSNDQENESPELLVANGIDPETGEPSVDPIDIDSLASWILQTTGGNRPAAPIARPESAADDPSLEAFGLADGINPDFLDACGWGILYPPGLDGSIKEALVPLIESRTVEAGGLFKEVELRVDGSGHCESANEFLERHGIGPGLTEPEKMSYYLLIVGGPDQVPFEFQYALGVEYAVGRLDLPDADAYRRYAESVNSSRAVRAKQDLKLWGPKATGDGATKLSADHLLTPLGNVLRHHTGWTTETFIGDPASKAKLAELANGSPGVLFTASHGSAYDRDSSKLPTHQGALICQGWDGPGRPVANDALFSASDVDSLGDLQRMIWFAFACFGAGTPTLDNFPGKSDLLASREIAPAPMVAALPRRLLSHPDGPILAFVGHVDRAWGTSFYWGKAKGQTKDFEECLKRLMAGRRVGYATAVLRDRYASLSTCLAVELLRILQSRETPTRRSSSRLVRFWTGSMDSRNYVVLGDPAAQLNVE